MFIGPPYNSLPFPVDIDYRHAAIFFNITNTKEWLPEPVTWSRIGPLGHARHPNDAVWWLPDIDVSDVAIQVPSEACMPYYIPHDMHGLQSRIGPLDQAQHPNDAVWWYPSTDMSVVAVQVSSGQA